MRTTLFTLCLLWGTAALGQAVSTVAPISSTFQIASHPEHASPQPLAREYSLLEGIGTAYVIAQGERPLWEFAPARQEVPLGDVARNLKREHAAMKKARFVRED